MSESLEQVFKVQDHCKGLAALAVLDANIIYSEVAAARLDQGTPNTWAAIKDQLEALNDRLADLKNDLETINGRG